MHKYAIIGIVIKLLLGSANYFAGKVMSSTCGTPLVVDTSKTKCEYPMTNFKKAFFITFCNFFSLSICMWIFYFIRRPKIDMTPYTRKQILVMAIPGTVQAVSFCLATTAQIIMSLSLAMIMKGAKVVLSALFTTLLFRKKLPAFKWVAVAVCVAGLALAGASEYMNFSKSNQNAGTILIGLSMALVSEAMFAFQVIFDERQMKTKGICPTYLVGMEGVYGCVILIPVVLMAWLVFPGDQNGSYENLPDTFYRIGQSGVIQGFLSFYLIGNFVGAIAAATITKYLTGVHSSLISVGRTIVVWVLELLLYYAGSEAIANQYGHKWDVYSPLKLTGFLIVVLSMFMYDGRIKLPWLDYSSVIKKPEVVVKSDTIDDVEVSEVTSATPEQADDTAKHKPLPAGM
jgi:drug/metabolite transporter (DMT)-like permease